MSSGAVCEMSSRDRTLSLGAVIISALGIGISYGIGYPLASLTFEGWGEPPWLTGMVGSAPALAILLLLPFFPSVVARLGAVPAIVIGCVLVAGGFVLMAIFPNPIAWLVLRFCMGAGLAFPWLVGETWINIVTVESARARMLALYVVALFSGYAAGPSLLELVGTTGWQPFAVGGVGALLAAVPVVLAASLAPDLPPHPKVGVLGTLTKAPIAMTAALLGGCLEVTFFSLLANYAIRAGIPSQEALRLLSLLIVGGVVLQFLIGWIADLMPRSRLLVLLSVMFAALVACLPLVITIPWLNIALIFVIGALLLGFYTVGLALLGERTATEDLAVANAAFLLLYQIGAIIGPFAAGTAMTLIPPHGFVIVPVAMALGGAVIVMRLARRGLS